MTKRRSDPPRRSPRRDDEDEAVGYGRPPKAHRFRKGQSGNPKGRPKGSRNIQAMVEGWLMRPVPMTLDGRSVMKPALEVMVAQMVQRAMKGDPKALKEALLLAERYGVAGSRETSPGLDLSDARKKLETKLNRLAKRRAEGTRGEDDDLAAPSKSSK